MREEEILALEFAEKYSIEIECISKDLEKHPDYGNEYIVYTIKTTRDDKFFIVRFGEADLGLDEGEILSKAMLYHGFLTRIPKYMPDTYEEFQDETDSHESEVDPQISKRWYLFEKEIYENALDLFSDIMNELKEIV